MAQSRHARLDDVLVEPLEDHDTERAAAICGEVTRRALRDFAPALVLLPSDQRRRVQAIAAFALTLFDFARQSGLEGEKLSQMNRWHFDLETTLAGEPPGQPVFVLLAAAETEAAWDRDALDDLLACARRRALIPRPESTAAVAADARALGRALAGALQPRQAASDTSAELAAWLVRVGRLLALGEDRRRHRAGLAVEALPEEWAVEGAADEARTGEAIQAECRRLRTALAAARPSPSLPRSWRRALTYAILAARRLVGRVESSGTALLEAPPTLGAFERLALVLRSRWLPL